MEKEVEPLSVFQCSGSKRSLTHDASFRDPKASHSELKVGDNRVQLQISLLSSELNKHGFFAQVLSSIIASVVSSIGHGQVQKGEAEVKFVSCPVAVGCVLGFKRWSFVGNNCQFLCHACFHASSLLECLNSVVDFIARATISKVPVLKRLWQPQGFLCWGAGA